MVLSEYSRACFRGGFILSGMTYSDDIADSEFASLCRSQIELLSKGLGAIWSAVYLTSGEAKDRHKQLALFEVYPTAIGNAPQQISELELEDLLRQVDTKPLLRPGSPIADSNQEDLQSTLDSDLDALRGKQLVLPLVHEDVPLGLLVTLREDRFWQDRELEQVKEIANTLAVGCFLARQSQWYRKQLAQQENLRRWEQEQLGNLLHQLRNPLTALRTFSKLLVKRLLPEDRNRRIAVNMLGESDRLKNLIDRFAEEVEPETEPITLSTTSVRLSEANSPSNFLLPSKTTELSAVDLEKLLEPLLQAALAIANDKNLELIAEIAPEIPLVQGDLAGLREVFNNLLDNAIKYTPATGQVRVSSICQGSLVGVAIADNGYGISELDQEHLFERHYRGAQAKSEIPGTGLGLAIAKQLIEQMGGDIEVISPNPQLDNSDFPGTIFTVWLSTIEQ